MVLLRKTPLLLASALSFTSVTSAEKMEKRVFANTCGLTCMSLLSKSPYADCNPTLAKASELGCFCSSDILAETFALCVNTYCDNRPDIYSELSKAFCHEENFNGVKYATALTTGQANEVHFGTFNTSLPIKAPYIWPAKIFDPLYRSTDTMYHQLHLGSLYGGAMVAFLGFFLVLAIAKNLIVKVMYFWRLPRKALSARPSQLTRVFQRYIVYPALFSGKHLRRPRIFGIYFSLPTRAQSLIIFGYITIGFVCQFVSYNGQFFPENEFFGPDYRTQLEEYVAARAGIMAFMQLPFIFLFAGRNNFMIALTGWSYATFNVYHKWVSRAMWSLAMIHGCTFTASAIRSGRLASGYQEAFWCWGVSALIIASFVMFQAVYNFRKLAYEIFLVIHIILVAMFVVALWYHAHDNGWMQYIYCAIAVWSFDRFVRLVRVLYFNFGFSGTTSAEVRVIGEEHYPLVQIKLRTTRKLNAKAGQYLFLHIGAICPWQAHPFSILDQDESGAYVLVARVHKGLTRKLHDYVLQGRIGKEAEVPELAYNAPTRNIRAGIDGLYGGPAPVDLYETALLIAGGAGITGVYPYIKHIMRNPNATTRHIKLVWSVRHTSTMTWLQPQLDVLREQLAQEGRVAIDIHIYVSNDPNASEDSSENGGDLTPLDSDMSGDSEGANGIDNGHGGRERVIDLHHSNEALGEKRELPEDDINAAGHRDLDDDIRRVTSVVVRSKRSDDGPSKIPVFYQRPDLTRIMAEVVGNAPSSVGVVSCGPGNMVDELRGAVCGNVEKAKGRIDYFEEAFEW